jgi:carboxyl-terminal processing protease
MRAKYFTAALFGTSMGALLAFNVGPSLAQQAEEQRSYQAQLQTFENILNEIDNRYVTDVDLADVVDAAIAGAVQSLDPHSAYLPPVDLKDMQVKMSGQFGGLGIEVTTENDTPKVVSPIDDTPAAEAGLQPGDFIIAADGEPLVGMELSDVVSILRGDVGEPITLTIVREGKNEPFDVEIVRDTITVQAAKVRMEGDVMVIRVSTFGQQTTQNIIDGVEEMRAEHDGEIIGAVIDLRNNPGGLLTQANGVSDLFLNEGVITSVKGRDGEEVFYRSSDGDILDGLPVTVLINQGSASASEIVAGALKDNGRASVVGMRSFGKGSVQTVVPLPNQGGLKLTTALYYTPSGRSIQALGVAPDILVEQPPRVEEDSEEETSRMSFLRSESSLRGAISNDTVADEAEEILKREQEALEAIRELRKNDFQLSAAIDAVKAKHNSLKR